VAVGFPFDEKRIMSNIKHTGESSSVILKAVEEQ
jgi:hypothetical protein